MTHRFPIKEIARQAGLGTATVDRVLNDRVHVSAQTKARVATALAELEGQQTQLTAKGRRLFVDVVVEAPSRFTTEIRKATEAILTDIGVGVFRPRFQFQELVHQGEVAATLSRVAKRGSDGVILKARNAPELTEGVALLSKAGIPVVTLVTDLPDSARLAYVGPDNAQAGQTAAYLLAQTRPSGGLVLTTRSQDSFYGEAERLRAFAAALPAQFRLLNLSGAGGLSSPSRQQLERDVREADAIVGVYSMGGGNGAILESLSHQRGQWITFIAHDLDAENRHLLQEHLIDFVLHHDLRADMRHGFQAIAAFHRLAKQDETRTSDIQIFTPFNVPKGPIGP